MVDYHFSGKCAFITGGSRGIGRAIALKLAQNGCDVGFSYNRNKDAADEVLSEITKLGRNCFMVKGNIKEEEHLQKMFEDVKDNFGKLHFFIANAASAGFGSALTYSRKYFEYAMQTNPESFLYGSQLAVEIMKETAKKEGLPDGKVNGRIIAISSTGDRHVIKGYIGVGTSKAAIITLVRYLAMELASTGITVNAVSGGPIETDAFQFFPEEVKENWLKNSPMGRHGRPEDVANAVAILLSDDANWITGQNIIVDGGLDLR